MAINQVSGTPYKQLLPLLGTVFTVAAGTLKLRVKTMTQQQEKWQINQTGPKPGPKGMTL